MKKTSLIKFPSNNNFMYPSIHQARQLAVHSSIKLANQSVSLSVSQSPTHPQSHCQSVSQLTNHLPTHPHSDFQSVSHPYSQPASQPANKLSDLIAHPLTVRLSARLNISHQTNQLLPTHPQSDCQLPRKPANQPAT